MHSQANGSRCEYGVLLGLYLEMLSDIMFRVEMSLQFQVSVGVHMRLLKLSTDLGTTGTYKCGHLWRKFCFSLISFVVH
jgi:hypothetical protein